MASQELIDAQFDRAVEIVQSLPKTGPIQTDYEEKLTMYSLFKQATAGNVKSPRPGIWDMLGRAKWDAWAKHKDLDPYEAKWLYVEALLKVLRKYSDKTVAMNLVDELESYGGDPSNIISSRTLSKSPDSNASGSTVSDISPSHRPGLPAANREGLLSHGDETDSTSDGESEDEAHDLPTVNAGRMSVDTGRSFVDNRPQSSLSSHQRYRTPLAGSLAMSPPPIQQRVPSQQPLPGFETPSAFADSIPPVSNYPPNQYFAGFTEPQRAQMSPHMYSTQSSHRSQTASHHGVVRPSSTVALERAMENVQVHLAALQERLETLESRALSQSNASGSPRRGGGSPLRMGGYGSPNGNGPRAWSTEDLGMWSLVLNPLSRGLVGLREFFAKDENRSPSMVIIRRLCLDVSFLVCVIALIGAIWRRSGVRRREVKAALVLLWRAIIGSRPHRSNMAPSV